MLKFTINNFNVIIHLPSPPGSGGGGEVLKVPMDSRLRRNDICGTRLFPVKGLKVWSLIVIFLILSFYNLSFPQDIKTDSLNLRFDSIIYINGKSNYSVDENNPDIKLFRAINNYRTPFLDNFLNITDKSAFPVAIALPVTLFAYGRIKDRTYDENTGILLAFSEVTNLLATTGIKYIVKRSRPYISLTDVHYKNTSFTDKYSFPSGHTSTTFAVSTMLMLRYPCSPQIYGPVYLWSLIVAYGRSYWGMHYPTDLLGGAVIGTLSSVAVFSIRKEIINLKNSIFNEKDKPDQNSDKKLSGIIAGTYIISLSLNEFIFPHDNIDISIIPEHYDKLSGFLMNINIHF